MSNVLSILTEQELYSLVELKNSEQWEALKKVLNYEEQVRPSVEASYDAVLENGLKLRDEAISRQIKRQLINVIENNAASEYTRRNQKT